MKKLKIKFWKPERALAMQIVEQEGLPEYKDTDEEKVKITGYPELTSSGNIWLRGFEGDENLKISYEMFKGSQERDAYLDKAIKAITDELFTTGTDKLKVGDMCEVRINEHCLWCKYKLLAILPEACDNRYITSVNRNSSYWMAFKEARPLRKRTEPKVETNGEIITYTWEEE